MKLSKRTFASIESQKDQLNIALKLSKILDGVQVLRPPHFYQRIIERSSPEEQEAIFRSLSALVKRIKAKKPPKQGGWVWDVHGAGQILGRGTSIETYLTKDMVGNFSRQDQEEEWRRAKLDFLILKQAEEEIVDLADSLEGAKCIACEGPAHPATGWQVSEKAILCGPCAKDFAQWYKRRMGNQNREIDGSSWNENASKSIIGEEDE